MCMGATCPLCSKKAWRGCGSHIASAMSSVPEEQWCTCSPRVTFGGKEYPPAAGSGQKTEGGKDGKNELHGDVEVEVPGGNARCAVM